MSRLIRFAIGMTILCIIICMMIASNAPTYEELDAEDSAKMFGGATTCHTQKCNGSIACSTRCDSSECSSATNLTSQHDCGTLSRSIYASGSSYKVCKQSTNISDKCTPDAGKTARCYYKTMTCSFYKLSFEFNTGTCKSNISNIPNILQGSYDCE